MKKYLVETFYTCTFKTVHSLNELNEKSMSEIDKRDDGEVEVIEVKLNNRKTKKIGDIIRRRKKERKNRNYRKKINKKIDNIVQNNNEVQNKIKTKTGSRFKMPDEEKDTFKKPL